MFPVQENLPPRSMKISQCNKFLNLWMCSPYKKYNQFAEFLFIQSVPYIQCQNDCQFL